MNNNNRNRKRIGVFLLVIALFSFLITVQPASAVCCDNACYETGVCVSGKWYQGCKDNAGTVHGPDDILKSEDYPNGCMACVCSETDHSTCEWKPNDNYCKNIFNGGGIDYICYNKELNSLPGYSTSECLNRDEKQEICTSEQRCNERPGYWTKTGEKIDYSSHKWGYQIDSYTQQTSSCCQDDANEYLIMTPIPDIGTFSACCNSSSKEEAEKKLCVDKNGMCWNEKGKEISCFDANGNLEGFDNDCDGLVDSDDPDCCVDADSSEACCNAKSKASGILPDYNGFCCGDSLDDNGLVKNDNLCYIKDSGKEKVASWIAIDDPRYSKGNVFTVSHPTENIFDVLKADKFYACNSKSGGNLLGSIEIINLNTAKSTSSASNVLHDYLCYKHKTGSIINEVFAECAGNDAYYSVDLYGGKRYTEGQQVTVIEQVNGQNKEVSKFCCTKDSAAKSWVDDLDNPACITASSPENSGCQIASTGNKVTKSGEEKPETSQFPAKGTNVCCGDDTSAGSEYYIETSIASAKYSACCDKQTDCVDDKGTCRNESVGGEKSCSDRIDNDCDGKIDQGQVSGYEADPDCCGDGDLFPTCCELKKGTWFDDGSGNTFCCGDDTPEYIVNSTITYPTSSYPLGPNKGTYSCCPDKDDCVYDGKCHKSANDGAKENANNGCYDGKDNDCDFSNGFSNGVSDFSEYYIDNGGNKVLAVADEDKFRPSNLQNMKEDDDCTITVTGKIVGEGGELDPIGDAHIVMQGSFNSPYSAGGVQKQPKFTYEADTLSADEVNSPDQIGTFTIVGVNGDSSYDITITHPDYESKTRHIEVGYDNFNIEDPIKIGLDHDTCNSDCTNIGNDLCNKGCDAVFGGTFGGTPHPNCYFGGQNTPNETRKNIAALCNEKVVGQLVNYTYEKDIAGNSLFVECCKGTPESFKPSTATISAGYGQDLIRTKRIITYKGKPVKMIIDAFG